jgi:hypothetical protein
MSEFDRWIANLIIQRSMFGFTCADWKVGVTGTENVAAEVAKLGCSTQVEREV